MARRTYIVQPGDTLPNVARRYYGAGNQQERIVKANGFLKFRRDSGDSDLNGTPNLHDGDVLTIIVDNPTVSAPRGAAKDEISVYIDESLVSTPDGSRLEKHFDACCDRFTSDFPWNPSDQLHRRWWGDPRNLAEVAVFAGSKQIYGGKFENSRNITKADESRMLVTGRSHTRLLEKSVVPSTSYPVERENEDLYTLVDWASQFFGLYATELSDNRERFKKVSIKKTERIFSWLASLANTRGRVYGPTGDGYGLNIWNPAEVDTVGRYVEGEAGFDPPEIEFDTTKLHNTYIGSARRARSVANIRGYRDYGFPEISYEHLDLQGTKPGGLQDAVDYNARKRYRDFFTVPFNPGGGLLNPQGEIWEPGQQITLRAPSSRIYFDMKFLVRKVTYVLDADARRVELEIIPPWVYLLPDEAAELQDRDLMMWS